MKKKVFVGISGGVDSAVAAHLLLESGYDVTGVFMKNWSGEDYGIDELCPWKDDLESAKDVANHLGIELKIYNFEKEYREAVIKDFFYQYSIGNTPNPDVLCNKYIKFSKFLDKAIFEGADFIATGHYTNKIDGNLYRAKDKNKDQTYFLYQLSKLQIEKSLFPLGNLLKSEVRDIANKINLPNANRKDSQGICFIGKIDVVDFLKKELKEKQGDIVDFENNKVVGKHNGVWFYTIGQRHGLGIGGSDIPYFVQGKDVKNNIIFVVKGINNPKLLSNKVVLNNFNELSTVTSKNLTCQIRHRGSLYRCKTDSINNSICVLSFIDKAWACAKGQSVVIYDNELCIGGGTIKEIVD